MAETETAEVQMPEIVGPEDVPDKPAVLERTTPTVLTEAFIQAWEAGVLRDKRFAAACVKATQLSHWLNFGTVEAPSLYLQAPGVEAIVRPLGIFYERAPVPRRVNLEDKEGGSFYSYECEGWIESRFLGCRIWWQGGATSRDKFFTSQRSWDPLVDYLDVSKKAVTNWLVGGVARLAGLRNPDPEIMRMAGIPVERIKRPDFSGARGLEGAEEAISEPQSKRLYAIYKNANMAEEVFKKKLVELGAVKDGKPTTLAVKKRDYDRLCAWVQAGGQEAPKDREPGQEG